MATSWNIRVKNTDTGVEFDDTVTFDVDGEVLSMAQNGDLGARIRTRRPETGKAVHEFERGTVTVNRRNYQTVRKHYGTVNRSTGIRV